MDIASYARRYPFDILVWNLGVWLLNSHAQTHSEAIQLGLSLTEEFGPGQVRLWDNTLTAPLPYWEGSPLDNTTYPPLS